MGPLTKMQVPVSSSRASLEGAPLPDPFCVSLISQHLNLQYQIITSLARSFSRLCDSKGQEMSRKWMGGEFLKNKQTNKSLFTALRRNSFPRAKGTSGAPPSPSAWAFSSLDSAVLLGRAFNTVFGSAGSQGDWESGTSSLHRTVVIFKSGALNCSCCGLLKMRGEFPFA